MTAPVAPAARGAGVRGWLEALDGLFAIPGGFREEAVDRAGALDMLRCGEPTLDALVAAGLPCGGAGERFDRYDLFNLALRSRSGASVPERSIEFALRWMNTDPESWYRPVEWRFSVELSCPLDGGCGPGAWWGLARPAPELFGGAVLELDPDGNEWITADGADGLAVTGRLRTRGGMGALVSPVLQQIVAEFMAAGYRWARMPEELQRDHERVLAQGVAPCISASLHLERRFADAGYAATTRRGWILGMLDLAHAWVEVTDDDGVTRPIDPIFAMLSRFARTPHPGFAAACLGSRMNRLLPTALPAASPLARHSCGGTERAPSRRTVIRRSAPATADPDSS